MKHYEYKISAKLEEISLRHIRTRRDLLLLLAYTVKAIVEQELLEGIDFRETINDDCKFIVHIDKMNRLIYCLDNKLFSYQMPFNMYEMENGKKCVSYNNEVVINSRLSSILITIFEDEDCLDGSIVDIYDRIDNLIKGSYENYGTDEEIVWKLIKHLLTYEPGYIRYDDDPGDDNPRSIPKNPEMHPRHHLDINFESLGTYKIGLKRKLTSQEMLSIMDNNQKCMVLEI